MRADQDSRAAAGDRLHDVPQTVLVGDPLELAAGEEPPQVVREFSELRRAGGPLADGHLLADEPPRGMRVEVCELGLPHRTSARARVGPRRGSERGDAYARDHRRESASGHP